MRITKLNIQNFRLLKNFSIDLEEELSLVIGKNNTGKTSLLTVLDKFLNDTKSFSYNDFNIDAYVDRTTIDFAAIQTMTSKIYCVISDNDYIVVPKSSHSLAQQLHAQIINVEKGGHFLAADGFTQLPQVWLALKQCIQ